MDTYTEIGAYEAKSHFPELLRKAKAGAAFRITNRGEHVADLVPPGRADKRGATQAAENMRCFAASSLPLDNISIKALIEEGRD